MWRSKTARALAIFISAWVALFLIQPAAQGSSTPKIKITPDQIFFGDSVKIILQGFEKNQLVTVSASSTNSSGQVWESHAEFLTDRRSRVNVAAQAPISGTYQHADAMGLFWSMAVVPGETMTNQSTHDTSTNVDIYITAAVNGQIQATAMLQRLWLPPGVKRIPIHDNGLRGILFLPAGKKPHRAVIFLGGSEGGLHETPAAFLASKGYATLSLAYFKYEDLPKSLQNIPLEYFETAIGWLQAQKEIRHDGVAVIGASRGAELALILGSKFPQIRAVIAIAPSSVIWPNPEGKRQPAWTYKEQALPFMNGPLSPEQTNEMLHLDWKNPMVMTQWCQIQLEDKTAVDHASIPVEKINGPVLLISGNDDRLWPSTEMADMLMERLQKYKHGFPDDHLAYPNVGHSMPLPGSTTMYLPLGGGSENTAAATVDSWAQAVKLLNSTFGR